MLMTIMSREMSGRSRTGNSVWIVCLEEQYSVPAMTGGTPFGDRA